MKIWTRVGDMFIEEGIEMNKFLVEITFLTFDSWWALFKKTDVQLILQIK